jgi:hypothetical protein
MSQSNAELTGISEKQIFLMGIVNGFIQSQVLFAGKKLGLFDELWPNPKVEDDLANCLGLSPRCFDALINASVSIGLLERNGKIINLKKGLEYWLVNGNGIESKICEYMFSDHYQSIYKEMGNLAENLKTNGEASSLRLFNYDECDGHNEISFGAHQQYMRSTISLIVKIICERIDFSGAESVLDLFGGSGDSCLAMLESYPHLKMAFVDVPFVTKNFMSESPLAEKVRAYGQDIFENDLPGTPDIITIFRSAHDWSDKDIMLILKKAFFVLPNRGRLIISERMFDDSHDQENPDLLFRQLGFVVTSKNFQYRSPAKYRGLLRAAGFNKIDVLDFKEAPYLFYRGLKTVIAHKE